MLAISLPLLLLAASPGAAAAPGPTLRPSVAIDGPSAGIGALSGVSLARDGSGGLVYLKAVGGIQHVFVSSLTAGAFAPGQQLDGSLSGDSSQPVIAAGDNGLLLVAFINGGQLYVVTRPATGAAFGAPQALAGGASNPAIALSIHGKGYVAFTVAGNGGHDVRSAFYRLGQWSVEPSALDAAPADDAGVGAGRPRVAAAGDGVAIVVWGEGAHVYSRRVWGSSPSVVFEQADVPSLGAWNEVSADLPTVAAGDDSSFGYVAFHELFANGSPQQSRVLVNVLQGSRYTGAAGVDGLATPGAEGAVQPQIALSEVNDGFATSVRDGSNQVVATRFGNGGANQGATRVDSVQSVTQPIAVTATTGSFSGLVAWQHDPGALGSAEIHARYYDGTTFGAEMVASSPSLGATDAARGLSAAGDIAGDMAIAWVQGSGAQSSIVSAQLWAPPGSAVPRSPARYATTSHPVLAWSPAREGWGPIQYTVTVDGAQVAQTGATALRLATPLGDGPHTWQVAAANLAGISTPGRAASLFVDTFAPAVKLTLSGRQRVGALLHVAVRYSDAPTALPGSAGSGVASVLVDWGDGTRVNITQGASHAFRRPGHYRLTVTAIDRAGNRTTVLRRLRIVK